MPKPQPRTLPFTNAFSGGDLSVIRGVSDHYFPSRYDELTCTVSFFEVEIKNFREMEIRATFRLSGKEEIIKKLYEEETWKFMRTENLMERFPEENKKFSTPAPLFCLMLNKYLQVVDASLGRVDRRPISMVYDTDADMLVLPTSFPPLADMPEEETYSFYDKKATVFYSDIKLDVDYEISVKLEANAGTFEFAPLFPFGKVIFEKFSQINSSEYGIEPMALKVCPEVSKEFPEWYEYQLDKLQSFEPRMPHFRPALPYRGTFPLFDLTADFEKVLGSVSKKDLMEAIAEKEIDLSKPIELKNYDVLRFGFIIVIPEDKNIDVVVRTIRRPLPPRIYEEMSKLPSYRDAFVEYTVFNLSHDKLRLRVETEIIDYTDKEVKVIFLHGVNNKKDKKAQVILAQCPRLKKDTLEGLTTPAKATMLCKVTNEDTKEILFEETYPIDILANDEMIWELNDLRSNRQYTLHDFICAWITPADKAGLMDKVRSGARAFHPDNMLGHVEFETLEEIRLHVKALYDYLANGGMSYLSQSFSSKISSNGQRVVLPERVLQINAGNCIDLTILFASLLEGFGLYSLIFLTPSHAYIGWGNKNNHEQIIFLETTLIGRADFDTAMAKGKENFEEDFLLDRATKPVFFPDIQRIKGMFMIDTQKARHSGQVSARRG